LSSEMNANKSNKVRIAHLTKTKWTRIMVTKGKLTAHPQSQTVVAKKTLIKNGSEVEYHKEDDDDDMEDNSGLRRA